MRFLAAMECWKDGIASDECVSRANRLMDALDRANPDYIDPEALEGVIQARVAEAVRLDRETTRTALSTLLQKGVYLGLRDVEVMQAWDRPGSTLRFSPEAAEAYAREVLP